MKTKNVGIGVTHMARPNKCQMSRKATEAALYQALELSNIDEKYFRDQVEEYMKFFDNLAQLNGLLDSGPDIEVLREKRQVTKEMRNILVFLGLKPVESGGGGFEEL